MSDFQDVALPSTPAKSNKFSWKDFSSSAAGGMNAAGIGEVTNDPGNNAMNIISSTGEGALAGTAVAPGWGSLIGAIAGLGKGIVTTVIGHKKADEKDTATDKTEASMADAKAANKIAGNMALVSANQNSIQSAQDRYAKLDQNTFARNFTLGFTRAMRGN